MKTLTLKEAYALATQGPFKQGRTHPENVSARSALVFVSASRGRHSEEQIYNAALLAHAFNVLPDAADAIEHVLIASEDGGSMSDINWSLLREVLAKINTVQIP